MVTFILLTFNNDLLVGTWLGAWVLILLLFYLQHSNFVIPSTLFNKLLESIGGVDDFPQSLVQMGSS
jgi:hypothetical protein